MHLRIKITSITVQNFSWIQQLLYKFLFRNITIIGDSINTKSSTEKLIENINNNYFYGRDYKLEKARVFLNCSVCFLHISIIIAISFICHDVWVISQFLIICLPVILKMIIDMKVKEIRLLIVISKKISHLHIDGSNCQQKNKGVKIWKNCLIYLPYTGLDRSEIGTNSMNYSLWVIEH